MSRSILLLNFVLLVLLGAGALELRRRWIQSREREAQALAFRPVPAPSLPASSAVQTDPAKIQAAQYFEVAEKFLFSRDRNPNVVIEIKTPPPPPPPKLMPNFPGVYGVMDLGMGPTVFMSIGTAAQQGYHLGEKIGEFTLIAANQKEITFSWEDKVLTRPLDELRARSHDSASGGGQPERMNANVNNNAVPEAPRPKIPDNVRPGPGADIGGGRKGCLPGDNSPQGTVVDGLKKVSYTYAFGPICFWESAR